MSPIIYKFLSACIDPITKIPYEALSQREIRPYKQSNKYEHVGKVTSKTFQAKKPVWPCRQRNQYDHVVNRTSMTL